MAHSMSFHKYMMTCIHHSTIIQNSFTALKICIYGQASWLKPVIPALWEAKAGGSRGQEIETILVNMVKPRLY